MLVHDDEKAVPRLRIVPPRPLQRFDKPDERRERRSDLMARIGHEIRPHLLRAPDRGEVHQSQQNGALGRARRMPCRQRLDAGGENALDGCRQGNFDIVPRLAAARRLDRGQQIGIAQRRRQVAPRDIAAQQLFRRPVGPQHLARLVQQQERIGQGVEGAFKLRPGGFQRAEAGFLGAAEAHQRGLGRAPHLGFGRAFRLRLAEGARLGCLPQRRQVVHIGAERQRRDQAGAGPGGGGGHRADFAERTQDDEHDGQARYGERRAAQPPG